MTEYFAALTGMQKVYLACATFGGSLFILRMILMLCGADSSDADADMDFDAHDVDLDADHGDMEHLHVDGDHGEAHLDTGLRLLTFQGLTAFVMMFGLTGYSVSRSSGIGSVFTVLLGIIAGMFGMWLIAKGFAVMRTLQHSGTMNIYDAVGAEGTVYLTITPGGGGKVRVIVSGRLCVMDAISNGDEVLRTGDRVTVTGVSNERMLVVTKA